MASIISCNPDPLPVVEYVCNNPAHALEKPTREAIRLLTGLGVEGDAHLGVTVQHRSRVRVDPAAPNLRQVHLLQAELHDELARMGMPIRPGEMGENITTRGIDLLALPAGTILRLGEAARVEVTGLRNPCAQLDSIHPGLMAATVERDAEGGLIRRAGIMSIVVEDGSVYPGDAISVEFPTGPHRALDKV